ncbi:DUF3800 domain-containing protein [Vreelandella titanicae]|uniref:DUF3800 domain-containing protein n=1 Tax=Vreelandella titanicae TaxID=664683 RepID=A0A558J6Y1_9GAMM|nr:DUF3800 domain-containing protein [Halomonas titanicae]TVU89395.1 DUF3800 domain-containing protein [Halomonas titanicae]
MECFRIDESGYTGFDLLNPDQLFQGATAISIDDDEAKHLIREHFPKLQADELKYRALARRPANRPRLFALQRDLLQHYKCVTYVCNKRFLLVLMFLDYAVEPFYFERGIDFYKDGQNYSLASLLYEVGPTILGQGALDRLLASFQRAVREKSQESLDILVQAARASRWQELPEAIGPLAKYGAPECLHAIAMPDVTTDAAFVVLQSLISRMEVMADDSYRVEHDQSKNLLTYHDLLQRFIDHKEAVTFDMSKITSFAFPLKLQSVTQVDSKSSPAVQLADIMIGAAIEALNSLRGQNDVKHNAQQIIGLYADHQLIHMMPAIDFAEQKHFRQGAQSAQMIDYFAKNFHLSK